MDINGVNVTEKEQELLEVARNLETPAQTVEVGSDAHIKRLEDQYKMSGKKVYRITIPVTEDDETEVEYTYLFKRPGTQSYDRYVKTMSNSATKASKAFALDNIVDELRDKLKTDLEEYPAMAINISGKLLGVLGLADSISVKKL